MKNEINRTLLIAAVLTLFTIVLGFVAWWTFAPLAFAAAFYFTRLTRVLRPVAVAMLAPALGWAVTALVRDVIEDGRISAKLATLLHVRYAPLVYGALFIVVLVPSFLAAYCGSQTSKALR